MSALQCINVACPSGSALDLTQGWCPKTKNGGILGLLTISCLIPLPDEAAVIDLLSGNAVTYIDLVLDPTGATTGTATITELKTLGLVGSFFKGARGSLTQAAINTEIGDNCGGDDIISTVWAYDVNSKGFDESPNMYDMVQFQAYLKNYKKYGLLFVTCADQDKVIYIPSYQVELTDVRYDVEDGNKTLQQKGLTFQQTFPGACIPKYLPAPNISSIF